MGPRQTPDIQKLTLMAELLAAICATDCLDLAPNLGPGRAGISRRSGAGRTIVDPNGPRIAHRLVSPIEGLNSVRGLVGEAGIQGRREPPDAGDDRQNADLAPVGQLIV